MSEEVLVANRVRSGGTSVIDAEDHLPGIRRGSGHASPRGVVTQQADAGDPLVVVEIEE